MRLTTKGRYAVTAMLDLAINDGNGPISLADISERHAISVSYLEQLFAKLRRAKLVDSVRGPGGGYTLGEAHMTTTILQIIDAIDEKVDATRCQGRGDCQNGCKCITHELWQDLSGQIRDFLGGISLSKLVEGHEQRLAKESQEEAELANQERPVTLV